MDSATYKVLRFLFPLPSGLLKGFLAVLACSFCHTEIQIQTDVKIILKRYEPLCPVLTCRGVFDKSERKWRAREMALDDVTSHLTWA